jgi:hypothetical protein
MQLFRSHEGGCRVGVGGALCAMLIAGAPSRGSAQQAAYRPPALALVQPAAGGSVPADRPVVVFRIAPGEPNDAVDVRSFAVAVDGTDRTGLFQVSAGEAWGPLSALDGASPLTAGAHQLVARICSSRGVCSEFSATVAVVPSPMADSETPSSGRRRKLFDALLDAVRKILVP